MSDPMAVSLEDIRFDPAAVDAMLNEYGIETPISLAQQQWLACRIVAGISLASAIGPDEDYYASMHQLGDGPSEGAEEEFARAFLRLMATDLAQAFDSSPNVSADLHVRIRDESMMLGLMSRH